VSHPLKFAEGGAASVGLMEGWASPLAAARADGGSEVIVNSDYTQNPITESMSVICFTNRR
jgi:hypothetical protein